jgi:phosphatidyl-myo-inositol dimannoside synthase
MPTLRVLYLADCLLPPGGIQTLSTTSIRVLRDLQDEGRLKYSAIAKRGVIPPDIECVSAQDSGGAMQFRVAREWLLRRSNLIFSDHLYTARFASRVRARHIMWAHLIEFDPPLDPMHQKSMTSCHRIFCDSDFTRRHLTRLYPAMREKLQVVHLGDCPRPELTNPCYQDNLPSQRLAMIGRMAQEERYKGHDEIIDALPEVLSAHPKCEIVMIGGGNDSHRLQTKVTEMGLSRNVQFLTNLDDNQLFRIIKTSCGILLPSRKEAFGLVYLYALWAGIPAVALRDSAGEEVLGECGVFAERQRSCELAIALRAVLSGAWHAAEASQRRYRDVFSYAAFKKRLADALCDSLVV